MEYERRRGAGQLAVSERALYWIGCAIIGYPAVCCVLLHILAGMWGAANYFVSVFRGTPILPWDFKALGTAVAVAGSYSLSMTWQIAICIMLVTLLAWALRPYYKMGAFSAAQRRSAAPRFRAHCRSAMSHPNRPPANTGHVRRRDRRVGISSVLTRPAVPLQNFCEIPNLWKWKNRMIPRRNASTLL